MLLSAFLVTILNILTTHALLTRKKTIAYCFFTFILNSIFAFGVAVFSIKYISDPAITKYILYFFAFSYIIYIHLVFNESIQKKIFTMFSISALSNISFFVAATCLNLFTERFPEINIELAIYTVRIFIQIIFVVIIYFTMRKHYQKVLRLVNDKTANFMSLYPLIAYFVLINNYPINFQFRNFNSPYDMFLFLTLMILGYLFVFIGVSSASKVISLGYNYKIIENQIELQRQNYKILNNSLEQLNTLKHDIRHHISSIKQMLTEKKYEQAQKYIEQFNQNELSKTIPTLCQNFTADSIIKYYFSIAVNKDIDFRTNLNIPEDININPLDLCVILGNCLENAIEACDKLEHGNKKYISLASQIVNSHLVFKIINSFNGNIIKNGELLQSTKNGASHGIGISSIGETVNKYKGNLDIKYTDHEFQATIIMNVVS